MLSLIRSAFVMCALQSQRIELDWMIELWIRTAPHHLGAAGLKESQLFAERRPMRLAAGLPILQDAGALMVAAA